MPAAVRGVRQASARPRAKKPATPGRSRSSNKGAQTAAKLRAARSLGLPSHLALSVAGGVMVLALAGALATGDRAETVGKGVGAQMADLGFKLKTVHVQGASAMAEADVLRATGLYKDQPILSVDLEKLRADVEKVGWVKEARIVRLLPDTLVVAVIERDALAVWQQGGRIRVIDRAGRVIPEADAARFPELPLIVGTGAAASAGEILPAVMSRPRLRSRLEALIRVDDRRWDLRLKDGSLVQLPAIDEEAALIQLDQLDRRQRILELGFARIDLRDPEMVAVRPRDGVLPGQLVAGGA
jgi:cell division protein FtsQ